jgi:RHS repeat-associated protein
VATVVYDAAGNVIAQTNPRGYTTTLAYDALNRLTQQTDALGSLATAVYDAASNKIASVDQRGNRTSFAYDALNRAVARTDPLGHTATVAYDAAGNVARALDPLGFTTTFGYDALNRLVSSQDPGGGIATTAYDPAGNVVNTIDPLGNKATFAYDALDRQTQAIDPRGGTTTTTFDAASNVVNVLDPVGNKTTFAYDALDRLTQQTDPLGNKATFAYDQAGRLTSTTDRLGRVRNLAYDAGDHQTGETWLAGGSTVNTLTYTYDPSDNLLTAASDSGAYTLTYDALDRAATEQQPFGLALTFSYDAASNRTQVQDSLGGTLTLVYDAADRLSSRQFGGTGQTPLRFDLTYTPRDQVATLTRYSDLGGTQKVGESDSTYDAAGRLSNLQHKNGSGGLLANYTYTYDLGSRVLTETLNGGTTTYGYDATNELTSDGTATYTYDLNGNRTMAGYQKGGANELTSDGVWTYTYDAEGNLTKKSKGANAETWTYGYDHNNQLVWAEDRQTDGGALIQRLDFKYDAFGNRVEKDLMVTTTTVARYAYDDGNVWADLGGTNALQARRLYGDGTDQVTARIVSAGQPNPGAGWYLADRQGSVRNLTDGSGALQATLSYDGYGRVLTDSNPTYHDRYQYTGRERDAETGLQYNSQRYYDPNTGRWTSQDPLGFGGGDANLYRYVGNGPTNATDPSGLSGEDSAPVGANQVLDQWQARMRAREEASFGFLRLWPKVYAYLDAHPELRTPPKDANQALERWQARMGARPAQGPSPPSEEEQVRELAEAYVTAKGLHETLGSAPGQVARFAGGMYAPATVGAATQLGATPEQTAEWIVALRREGKFHPTLNPGAGARVGNDPWVEWLYEHRFEVLQDAVAGLLAGAVEGHLADVAADAAVAARTACEAPIRRVRVYHDTSANRARKIVGDALTETAQQGFKPGPDGAVFLAEDLETGRFFARTIKTIPGKTPATKFTVIEFTMDESLLDALTRRGIIGEYRDAPLIQVGHSPYERILIGPKIDKFNEALKAGLIRFRRLKQ